MICDRCGKEFYTGFSKKSYHFCSERCLIDEFGYQAVKEHVTNWFEEPVVRVLIDDEEHKEEEAERRRLEEEEEERRRWEEAEEERLAEGSGWW